MSDVPLPPHVGEESHGPSQSPVKLYDADQMHAHAAAVSADLAAENARLREALREYIDAADNSMTASDDVAAMLRFGEADKAARAALKGES